MRRYASSLILLMILSCDSFKEDLIQPDRQVIFSHTEYYILPGSSVIIDLKSIVKQTFITASLSISKNPSRGELSQLDTLLLKYKPGAEFTEGQDQFVFSILSDGSVVKTETMTIFMKQKEADFPCGLYAVEDKVTTSQDQPVTIKFLDNDRICGFDKAEIQSSIYSVSERGVTILSGDSIVYVPSSGHIGGDSIVYKITGVSSEGTPVVSHGLITLTITEVQCHYFILNEYVLNLTDDPGDPISSGECSGGYDIPIWGITLPCEKYDYSVDQILQTSYSGSVCVRADGRLSYVPDITKTPKNEYAQMEICVYGNCMLADIYITREAPLKGGSWTKLKPNDHLATLFFVGESTGYAGGPEGVIKTIDSGATWSNLETPIIDGVSIYPTSMYFLDADRGFVGYMGCGNDYCKGGVMSTTDGGVSWNLTEIDYPVTSVFFTSSTTGFVGTSEHSWEIGSLNRIYKTTDGGATWKIVLAQIAGANGGDPVSVQFVNSSTGYTGMYSKIMKTSNGGVNWQLSIDNNYKHYSIPSIAAVSDNVICAILGNFGPMSIWRTSNGETWDQVASHLPVRNLAFSPSGSTGFAVGGVGNYPTRTAFISISNNNGLAWQELYIDKNFTEVYDAFAVAVPSDRVAYVLCPEGVILKYISD